MSLNVENVQPPGKYISNTFHTFLMHTKLLFNNEQWCIDLVEKLVTAKFFGTLKSVANRYSEMGQMCLFIRVGFFKIFFLKWHIKGI